MTIIEAINKLKKQNEELLQILDRISALEGRVPGEALDNLIARVAQAANHGSAIDNSLLEWLESEPPQPQEPALRLTLRQAQDAAQDAAAGA